MLSNILRQLKFLKVLVGMDMQRARYIGDCSTVSLQQVIFIAYQIIVGKSSRALWMLRDILQTAQVF